MIAAVFIHPLHVCLLAAPGLSLPWAIVIFSILIGLAITLSPARRTYEVKRPKDE